MLTTIWSTLVLIQSCSTYCKGIQVISRAVNFICQSGGCPIELGGHEDDRGDGIRQLLLDVVQAASPRSAGTRQVRVDHGTAATTTASAAAATTVRWCLVVTALNRLLSWGLVIILKMWILNRELTKRHYVQHSMGLYSQGSNTDHFHVLYWDVWFSNDRFHRCL